MVGITPEVGCGMLVMHRDPAGFEEVTLPGLLPLQRSLLKVTFLLLDHRIYIMATYLQDMRGVFSSEVGNWCIPRLESGGICSS